MPSSPNRRRIEIPAALYERLEERARRDGQTIAGMVATLLAGALDAASVAEGRREGGDERGTRANLQQLLHNDALQLRELQFVGQRLDLVLRVLAEGLPVDEGELAAAEASQAARQRLLEALTEYRVAVPPPPVTTLAQAGEPRPIQTRTLWQRPQRMAEPEDAEE